MRCWRTIPELRNIVLRKYLRFALCDECIELREKRRFARSYKEKIEIQKEETKHYALYMKKGQHII